MAWDTTDLASYNDIIYQDGVFAYNFTASGAIRKGQAVCVAPSMTMCVMVTTAAAGACDVIGICTGDAADTAQVAIAGPGNIVYACCDSGGTAGTSGIQAGDPVYGTTFGVLTETAGNAIKIAAYALDTPTIVTTTYVGKFLLV